MKKLLLILLFFIVSCHQENIEPLPELSNDIFSQKENIINNGTEVNMNLPKDGIYFLSMIDVETNELLTKERFIGINGLNKLNIYTKSVQSRYLYLVLHDENKIELNKTKLVLK
jgi:hypothetical protein